MTNADDGSNKETENLTLRFSDLGGKVGPKACPGCVQEKIRGMYLYLLPSLCW